MEPSSFLRSPSFFRNYYCGKLTSFSQIRQSEKKVGKNGAKGVGIKPSYLEEAEKKENWGYEDISRLMNGLTVWHITRKKKEEIECIWENQDVELFENASRYVGKDLHCVIVS